MNQKVATSLCEDKFWNTHKTKPVSHEKIDSDCQFLWPKCDSKQDARSKNFKMNVSCHSYLSSKKQIQDFSYFCKKKLDNSWNSNKLRYVNSDVMSFKLIPPFLFMSLVIFTNYAREGLSFLNLLINYLTQPHWMTSNVWFYVVMGVKLNGIPVIYSFFHKSLFIQTRWAFIRQIFTFFVFTQKILEMLKCVICQYLNVYF